MNRLILKKKTRNHLHSWGLIYTTIRLPNLISSFWRFDLFDFLFKKSDRHEKIVANVCESDRFFLFPEQTLLKSRTDNRSV